MGCQVIDIDYDAESTTIEERIVTARQDHFCYECAKNIEPGDKYERYTGVQEGTVFTTRTCLDCVSIRKAFFKGGVCMHGCMMDELFEHIEDLDGQVDSSCIIQLTGPAKTRVFNCIEEIWDGRNKQSDSDW